MQGSEDHCGRTQHENGLSIFRLLTIFLHNLHSIDYRQQGPDLLLLEQARGDKRGVALLLRPLTARRDRRVPRTSPGHILPQLCLMDGWNAPKKD